MCVSFLQVGQKHKKARLAMMSRLALEAVAAGITLALGALFHFTYAWSGRSAWVKWFSAKDESVVAHLSLVHVPFLAMTVLSH